jgi:hypothetical protein
MPVDTIQLDPQYVCKGCGGHGYHTRRDCPNITSDLIALGVAFIILTKEAPTSIVCPNCHRVSLDPEDTLRLLKGRERVSRKKRYVKLCDDCRLTRELEQAGGPSETQQ